MTTKSIIVPSFWSGTKFSFKYWTGPLIVLWYWSSFSQDSEFNLKVSKLSLVIYAKGETSFLPPFTLNHQSKQCNRWRYTCNNVFNSTMKTGAPEIFNLMGIHWSWRHWKWRCCESIWPDVILLWTRHISRLSRSTYLSAWGESWHKPGMALFLLTIASKE